jgi:hypothetical protein
MSFKPDLNAVGIPWQEIFGSASWTDHHPLGLFRR